MNKTLTIGLSIVLIGLIVAMVGPAIKFFFRGLLAMMNHPVEALCFIGLLTAFLFIADRVSEK